MRVSLLADRQNKPGCRSLAPTNGDFGAVNWSCQRPRLADFAFGRPVTATIADITGARRAKVSPTILAIVMARYAARSRFTISRTVFLLSPTGTPTKGSPKADLGPCGGFGQWNQRSPRLNVRNGPFLLVTPRCTEYVYRNDLEGGYRRNELCSAACAVNRRHPADGEIASVRSLSPRGGEVAGVGTEATCTWNGRGAGLRAMCRRRPISATLLIG
jgi:hypothetical protein